MSSLAAAAILRRAGFEPILQMTCRDRNRIALAGDLLGAAALGIENFLILRGDDPSQGDAPEAKPVFDLDSREVMSLARRMRDEGVLPSGRKIGSPLRLFIGAADTPHDPAADWRPGALIAKHEAGAEFVQTQFCFDAGIVRRYIARLSEFGLTEKLRILIGVGPLASTASARWMNEKLFGVTVPEAVIERLERARDPGAEGRRICIDLIHELRQIEGVAGAHIMAPRGGAPAIAEVVNGLTPSRT
jgi:methylenetetrahydrofolate reductase (NADH)